MDQPHDLLLFVDDEEMALKYFTVVFKEEYEVLTAASAELAWELVERHGDRLALVISDQRMPGQSGVEFLTAVRERHPRSMRLLTTAYADLRSAIDAVNHGAIYAYITKPWNIEEMRQHLRRAIDHYHLLQERESLLADKLQMHQRLLLVDRLRSCGLLASALGPLVQGALAAVTDFFRQHPQAIRPQVSPNADLWCATLDHTRMEMARATQIAGWLIAHRGGKQTPADILDLIATIARQEGVTICSRDGAVKSQVDARLLNEGVRSLLAFLGASGHQMVLEGRGRECVLTCRAGASPLPAAGDPLASGLAAYLAIYHHQGRISIPVWHDQERVVRLDFDASAPSAQELEAAFLADLERHAV